MRKHILLLTSFSIFFANVQADDENYQEPTFVQEDNTSTANAQEVETTPAKQDDPAPKEEQTAPVQEPESKPIEVIEPKPAPVETIPVQIPAATIEIEEVKIDKDKDKEKSEQKEEKPVVVVPQNFVHPDYILKHIVNQGASLFLNDYSGWNVSKKYLDTSAQWQKGDTIRLFYEQTNWFSYRVEIRNLTRNESVYASLKEVPNIFSPDVLWLQNVDLLPKISLNDGTVFQGLATSDLQHSGWKTGDLVTFLYWGELDGTPACALWNHSTNTIIGEMMLIEYTPVTK